MDTPGTKWRRSSLCVNSGCVEVALSAVLRDGDDLDGILVRDSKLGDASPILSFTPEEWAAFIAGVKAGEFDSLGQSS